MQHTPGGTPDLVEYEADLGLPEGFSGIEPEPSPAAAMVLELRRGRYSRKTYLTGVLLAFVAMAEELAQQTGEERNSDALVRFPPVQDDASGSRKVTLTVSGPASEIALRPRYNLVETVARHWLLRGDYPNCAPHATGEWETHSAEYEAICSMSSAERRYLAGELWAELLGMPELAGAADEDRQVRPFEKILLEFPNTQRREPAGAVLQALAYAYYRADSPHLTMRPYKVGAGSSRVGNVGDVDGWIGAHLGLSVEVKDLEITAENLDEFDQFLAGLARWPDATGIALAMSFDEEASDWLIEREVLPFDRARMADNVKYWDRPKQQVAVLELHFYFAVIQQNTRLTERFEAFCEEMEISLDR